MRMSRLAVAIAAGLAASSVLATPITLPGPSVPLFIQFTDAEQVSASNSLLGQTGPIGNRGIVELSSIVRGTVLPPTGSDIQGGGANVFVNGFGPQVLGIFQDHVVPAPPGSPTKSDSGFLDLYWWDTNTQNTGTELASAANLAKWGVNSTTYTGFSCATGAETSDPGAGCFFLGRFDFTTGSDPGFPGIDIVSAVDAASADGTAKSYLDVDAGVPGFWSSQLNTNFFTLDPCNHPVGYVYAPNEGCLGPGTNPGAPGGISYTHATDIRLDNNFSHNGAGAWNVPGTDIFGLRSNDPGRTVSTSVPEPGSLTLLGLALAAFATVRRRWGRAG